MTRGIVPPAFVSACAKLNCSSVHDGGMSRPEVTGFCNDIREAVLQSSTKVGIVPVRPGVVVQILRSVAQRIVRIGSGRDPDIDVQVFPCRRVIREIAGRRAAVLEDDVVQDPLPAAVRQVDRQRRCHRGSRSRAGRDVRNDLIRDKRRRDGKRGTDRTSRHRHVPEAGAKNGWSDRTQTVVAAGMIPFSVTVQMVVLPAITGLGVQVNAVTVGYTDVSVAVLFTPL